MIGGAYEDGEETKSDFLARMLLMGRIEIDPENKSVVSHRYCRVYQELAISVRPNPPPPSALPPCHDNMEL